MACVFNLSRPEDQKSRLAGKPVSGELFWEPDRAEMLTRIKATTKQCLIFKVYGATRHGGSEDGMLAGLRQVCF